MGRKLDRLMARVSALEEAFTQLLSENLRHGTVQAAPRKKAKKLKAKIAAPKKRKPIAAARASAAALPKAAPIVRPASPTTPVAEPYRATAAPTTR
jgi:hypothetical protein